MLEDGSLKRSLELLVFEVKHAALEMLGETSTHDAGPTEAVANPAMPLTMLRDFSREGCGTIGTKTRAPGVRH